MVRSGIPCKKIIAKKRICCCIPVTFYEPLARNGVGRVPINKTCSNCRIPIHTKIKWVATKKTLDMARKFSYVCLCCVPMMIKRWKVAVHICPICRTFIGMSD